GREMGDDGLDGRGDRPFVVEAGPARAPGPSRIQRVAIGLAALVLAGLTAWGLLVAPGPPPVPTGPPVAAASPTPTPGPTLALPHPDGEGLPSARVATEAEAFAALAVSGGWPQCPMWRPFSDGAVVDAAAVEAALRDVSSPAGMYTVRDSLGTDQRVWVGGGEDDAARGFGGSAVVRVGDLTGVGDVTWTSMPASGSWEAVRLDRVHLQDLGLDAWVARVRAVPAPYCNASFGGPPATVVEVPGDADPYPRFVSEAGWFVCRTWQRFDDAPAPTAADVDAAADHAGIGDGPAWLAVPVHTATAELSLPVWVGDDPSRAGTVHGSRLVVLGTGTSRRAWMAVGIEGVGAMAVAFDVVTTPGGRTAWLPTGTAAGVVGRCEPAGTGGEAPSPSLGPAPAAATLPVELLRGIPNASALLAQRLGWTDCRMATIEPYPLEIPLADVDAVATELGVESGMLRVSVPGATQPVPVFLGTDLVELARIEQVPVVAIDGRPVAWLADETRAREWRASVTPAGRTVWAATGAGAWPDGGCAPPPDATPGITGFRSLTCWTDRAHCLEAIAAARRLAPEAFGPGVDVAAGLASTCPMGVSCPWSGPDDPVTVTVTPEAWHDLGELRVFTTGLRRLSGVALETAAEAAPPATLGLASRPAIALPESTAPAGAACDGASIRGTLRGSPWDPRVAWVDEVPVRWPAGLTAMFVPDLRLYAADGSLVAGAGNELLLVGSAAGAPGTDGFDACQVVSPRTAEP
ncbi:MAG TPA: hypothetical protein VFQ75_02920, partial [Candidatus Limnocylindrales bacterium]|nr:hypothetical protein [Candidatus Limnocylindrales bacterium]